MTDEAFDNLHRCLSCGVTGGGIEDGMCDECRTTELQFLFPKTALAMLVQVHQRNTELQTLLIEAEKSRDEWRTIANGLVYTEHDDYKHIHRNPLDRCERCVAHEAFHQQVNTEENP